MSESDRRSSRVPTLLGIPYDGASSFETGAGLGPGAIRRGLVRGSTNGWSETGLDVLAPGLLEDAGDLDLADGSDVRERIERRVAALLAGGAVPLVLGGDHSITYPVVRAMHTRYPDLAILHFDAHADLYDEFEGNRFSHACPFARIMEAGLASRLVQVGIRTLNAHQRSQAARFGVELHEMRDWTGPFALRFDRPLYISLDLDVLDPAFAPGIAHPEPGGLSVREVVAMLAHVEATVVGADVVELNPHNDPSPVTELVGAKLVKELVALMVRQRAG